MGLVVEVVSSEEMRETETMIETLMTAQMIEITEIVIVVEMEDMEETEEEMEVLEAEAVIIGQQEFKTEVTGKVGHGIHRNVLKLKEISIIVILAELCYTAAAVVVVVNSALYT